MSGWQSPRWRHEIATQEEGEAHFVYRLPQNEESLRELEAWIALVLKKVRLECEADFAQHDDGPPPSSMDPFPAPPETP